MLTDAKAIADGPVGQVLAKPCLFLKVKMKVHLRKASNKQKYWDDFWTCSACYIMIQQIEKGYDEVENYRLPMHTKKLWSTRYSIVQKLSNKQSAI